MCNSVTVAAPGKPKCKYSYFQQLILLGSRGSGAALLHARTLCTLSRIKKILVTYLRQMALIVVEPN